MSRRRIDLDALIDTQEAARLCHVRPGTIRQWRYRRLLPVAGRGPNNRPLHRVGDVLEVERATRTGIRDASSLTNKTIKCDTPCK